MAMAKVRPDFSFDREGRPLSDWLLDLVGDDASARLKAGDVLQGMWFGVPYAHTDLEDLDWEEHNHRPGQDERFRRAVRDAVEAASFPKAHFVRRLILYRLMIDHDWRARVRKAAETSNKVDDDRYVERLVRRLEAAGDDDAERAEAVRRLGRWFCASVGRGVKRDQEIYAGAEAMSVAGMASHLVFEALDVALLADRAGLRVMLDDEGKSYQALGALERIGPAGVDFAPALIARLDAAGDARHFDAPAALGSIGRSDPDVVDALLQRLVSRSATIRSGAAASLAHAGPPLAGRVDEAVSLLLDATRDPDEGLFALEALASVGREREDALQRILDCAAPRPPRWVPFEGYPDQGYDAAMAVRGEAISALRHFRTFARRSVLALIDAIDTFEEYDPDWQYDGEHGRVCRVLVEFGPDAAPAVPRRVAYLESWRSGPEEGREWPKDVLSALAAIGPAAAEALPVLLAIRREGLGDEAPGELDCNDPLDRAILRLQGA